MKFEFSELDGVPYVLAEEGDGCEALVDACLEAGAVMERPNHATRYVVRFPSENIEEYTGAELRRKVLESALQRKEVGA